METETLYQNEKTQETEQVWTSTTADLPPMETYSQQDYDLEKDTPTYEAAAPYDPVETSSQSLLNSIRQSYNVHSAPFPPISDRAAGYNLSKLSVQIPDQDDQQVYDLPFSPLGDSSSPAKSTPTTRSPTRKEKTKTHTPRPANSFILYRREKHVEIMQQYKGVKTLNNNVISKIVANMWKSESQEVKAHYASLADAEKKAHMLKYPDYKYRPRKSPSKRGSIASPTERKSSVSTIVSPKTAATPSEPKVKGKKSAAEFLDHERIDYAALRMPPHHGLMSWGTLPPPDYLDLHLMNPSSYQPAHLLDPTEIEREYMLPSEPFIYDSNGYISKDSLLTNPEYGWPSHHEGLWDMAALEQKE